MRSCEPVSSRRTRASRYRPGPGTDPVGRVGKRGDPRQARRPQVKIVDLNVPLYAIDSDSPHHDKVVSRWNTLLSGDESIGLPWIVLSSFLRLTTHKRVFEHPLSIPMAFAFVDEWLALDVVFVPVEKPVHALILRRLLESSGTAANLVADAHIAAIALSHDATVDDERERVGDEPARVREQRTAWRTAPGDPRAAWTPRAAGRCACRTRWRDHPKRRRDHDRRLVLPGVAVGGVRRPHRDLRQDRHRGRGLGPRHAGTHGRHHRGGTRRVRALHGQVERSVRAAGEGSADLAPRTPRPAPVPVGRGTPCAVSGSVPP